MNVICKLEISMLLNCKRMLFDQIICVPFLCGSNLLQKDLSCRLVHPCRPCRPGHPCHPCHPDRPGHPCQGFVANRLSCHPCHPCQSRWLLLFAIWPLIIRDWRGRQPGTVRASSPPPPPALWRVQGDPSSSSPPPLSPSPTSSHVGGGWWRAPLKTKLYVRIQSMCVCVCVVCIQAPFWVKHSKFTISTLNCTISSPYLPKIMNNKPNVFC